MAVTIVFETHAPTTDNEAGIASGWLPGELSLAGRRLAAELGQRRRNDGIAAVFVSDLRRAVQTAAIAFPGGSVPVFEDARLRECNYGTMNGQPARQLASERARHIDTPYPGGQSYRDVVAATEDFLHDLASEWQGKRILVISHSANKWAFDCLLAGGSLEALIDAPFGWQEGWEYVLPDGPLIAAIETYPV